MIASWYTKSRSTIISLFPKPLSENPEPIVPSLFGRATMYRPHSSESCLEQPSGQSKCIWNDFHFCLVQRCIIPMQAIPNLALFPCPRRYLSQGLKQPRYAMKFSRLVWLSCTLSLSRAKHLDHDNIRDQWAAYLYRAWADAPT